MAVLDIRIAQSQSELEAIYRTRYQIFCKEVKIFDSSQYPDKMMFDKYDDRSINFYTQNKKGEMISIVRFITFDPEDLFPAQKESVIPIRFCGPKTLEISRGGTLQRFQRMTSSSFRLLDFVYEYGKANGYQNIIALANYEMYEFYEKLNMPFIYLGKPFVYRNFKSIPLSFEIKTDFHVLKRK